jgi:hypothetical protein
VTWLLKLYPPAWRRRYGREFSELIATQSASFGMVVDLVAGAIDAWIHPQSSTVVPATSDAIGETTMLAKMLRIRCAGYGPTVTSSDLWKSLGVTLGGTAALALVWTWANRRFAGNPYVYASGMMAYVVPILAGLHYTSLKGRPARVQSIFIVGLGVVLMGLSLIATWVGARL